MEVSDISALLADVVARQCAPTLLGVKPANMFTFCGCFAPRCPDCDDDAACAPVRGPVLEDEIVRRRAELTRAVRLLERSLAAGGVRCTVLAWRPFGALVYVWRPALLTAHLRDARIRRDLAAAGYTVAGASPGAAAGTGAGPSDERLRRLIGVLGRRFGASGVPHEVGYFLGYPYEDVRGFIDHEGRDFLCCGCWKVYANARAAQYRFARYKRCVRRVARLYRAGVPLAELVMGPVRTRAA